MSCDLPDVSLVGVTGYGALYLRHLARLHAEGRVRLRDAVVVNPEAAGDALAQLASLGTRVWESFDRMLAEAEAPDLVCLPVGIPAHRPLTEKALAWGARVLLEKPAAGCLADWEAMRAVEERSGLGVAVGFQNIHGREIQDLKRRLCAGELGRIRRIAVLGLWPRDDTYYRRNAWAGKERVNGVFVRDSPLQNAFAHFLNLGLFLSGGSFAEWRCAERVEGRLIRARAEIETFDTCSLRFTLAGGLPFDLHLSHACAETQDPILRVETDRGRIEWGIGWTREPAGSLRNELPLPHADMFADVVDWLRDPEVFVCSLREAGHALRAVEIASCLPVEPVAAGEIGIEANGTRHWLGVEDRLRQAFEAGTLA